MSTTSIEWVQRPGTEAKVFNPSRGCSRVSEGCRHCWAERMAHRFNGPGQPYEGLTTIRGGRPGWTGEVRFVPEMLAEPLRWRKPCTVFVNSMSDLFSEKLSDEQIAAVFGVMAACPQHTFQVLTKRAKRMREWFEWATTRYVPVHHWCLSRMLNLATGIRGGVGNEDVKHAWDNATWPLKNAWIGVSIENQATADERIQELLQCPAAVHFVSAEPLLGGIDLEKHLKPTLVTNSGERMQHPDPRIPSQGGSWEWGLDWVIIGSESGPGARPMQIEWASAMRPGSRSSRSRSRTSTTARAATRRTGPAVRGHESGRRHDEHRMGGPSQRKPVGPDDAQKPRRGSRQDSSPRMASWSMGGGRGASDT